MSLLQSLTDPNVQRFLVPIAFGVLAVLFIAIAGRKLVRKSAMAEATNPEVARQGRLRAVLMDSVRHKWIDSVLDCFQRNP